MRKIFLLIFFVINALLFGSSQDKPLILVNIPPYKSIMEELTDGLFEVEVFVPSGVSSHNFEPSPKQMLQAKKATFWLTMGEPFEEKVLVALKRFGSSVEPIPLWKGVNLIKDNHCACSEHTFAFDPHFWLSPQEMISQIEWITQKMSARFPEHKNHFETKRELLVQKLKKLHDDCLARLSNVQNKTFLTAHHALAYFAREFQLKILPIEHQGKEPTAKSLTEMLLKAKKENAVVLFVQKEHPNKASHLVAKKLNIKEVELDLFLEDYFSMISNITEKFVQYGQ